MVCIEAVCADAVVVRQRRRECRSGDARGRCGDDDAAPRGLAPRERLGEDGVLPAHYDLRFVKPLDEQLLHEVFSRFKKVVTVEDGCVTGGMGSAVLEFMSENGYQASVTRLGIPDRFIEHGGRDELLAGIGLDPKGIAAAARRALRTTATGAKAG